MTDKKDKDKTKSNRNRTLLLPVLKKHEKIPINIDIALLESVERIKDENNNLDIISMLNDDNKDLQLYLKHRNESNLIKEEPASKNKRSLFNKTKRPKDSKEKFSNKKKAKNLTMFSKLYGEVNDGRSKFFGDRVKICLTNSSFKEDILNTSVKEGDNGGRKINFNKSTCDNSTVFYYKTYSNKKKKDSRPLPLKYSSELNLILKKEMINLSKTHKAPCSNFSSSIKLPLTSESVILFNESKSSETNSKTGQNKIVNTEITETNESSIKSKAKNLKGASFDRTLTSSSIKGSSQFKIFQPTEITLHKSLYSMKSLINIADFSLNSSNELKSKITKELKESKKESKENFDQRMYKITKGSLAQAFNALYNRKKAAKRNSLNLINYEELEKLKLKNLNDLTKKRINSLDAEVMKKVVNVLKKKKTKIELDLIDNKYDRKVTLKQFNHIKTINPIDCFNLRDYYAGILGLVCTVDNDDVGFERVFHKEDQYELKPEVIKERKMKFKKINNQIFDAVNDMYFRVKRMNGKRVEI